MRVLIGEILKKGEGRPIGLVTIARLRIGNVLEGVGFWFRAVSI